MPITHSAAKRLRQAKKRTKHNSQVKTRIDRARKEIKRLVGEKKSEAVLEKLRAFASLVDKAEQKGVLKRNVAARTKSRTSKLLKSIS